MPANGYGRVSSQRRAGARPAPTDVPDGDKTEVIHAGVEMSTAIEQERPTGVREVHVGVRAATDGEARWTTGRSGRRLGSG